MSFSDGNLMRGQSVDTVDVAGFGNIRSKHNENFLLLSSSSLLGAVLSSLRLLAAKNKTSSGAASLLSVATATLGYI